MRQTTIVYFGKCILTILPSRTSAVGRMYWVYFLLFRSFWLCEYTDYWIPSVGLRAVAAAAAARGARAAKQNWRTIWTPIPFLTRPLHQLFPVFFPALLAHRASPQIFPCPGRTLVRRPAINRLVCTYAGRSFARRRR